MGVLLKPALAKCRSTKNSTRSLHRGPASHQEYSNFCHGIALVIFVFVFFLLSSSLPPPSLSSYLSSLLNSLSHLPVLSPICSSVLICESLAVLCSVCSAPGFFPKATKARALSQKSHPPRALTRSTWPPVEGCSA